uniref:Uncharacterized protein n=1 Tax=Chromera velia CCMP2878 TaxID=1169474 RepID=A0A0G4FDD1_9ALVE|eukprot:Cvel_3230.t1-p1 / transcript=Cvel_3230.t1 / gene=Cvel_3230 / organism=Chromera_velia_CCMP2878 / gene_product=hypothetical protein / transcript_product=hypothetical protein / location=Cvel_scaffold126:99588-100235(+) / protein_length=216 / sequence_SO=supercontig / SO=protein_coding / is_pseudo=false
MNACRYMTWRQAGNCAAAVLSQKAASPPSAECPLDREEEQAGKLVLAPLDSDSDDVKAKKAKNSAGATKQKLGEIRTNDEEAPRRVIGSSTAASANFFLEVRRSVYWICRAPAFRCLAKPLQKCNELSKVRTSRTCPNEGERYSPMAGRSIKEFLEASNKLPDGWACSIAHCANLEGANSEELLGNEPFAYRVDHDPRAYKDPSNRMPLPPPENRP